MLIAGAIVVPATVQVPTKSEYSWAPTDGAAVVDAVAAGESSLVGVTPHIRTVE